LAGVAAGATRDWHYEHNFFIVSEPAISAVPQASTSPLLTIRNVAKAFGKTPVLRDISLQVAEGEFLTILGESGSGKTTLLRIIAGFENASSGKS
jgi:ABC-type glutathione transport system ATPase component